MLTISSFKYEQSVNHEKSALPTAVSTNHHKRSGGNTPVLSGGVGLHRPQKGEE